MLFRYHPITFLLLVGLLTGLVAALPGVALAQGTSVSSHNDKLDFHPNVAESPDGSRLIATWITDLANLDKDVRVATSTDGGQSWSTEIVIFDAPVGDYLDPTRIVFDGEGNAHVVFMAGRGERRTLYHRYLPAGADPAHAGDWRSGQEICRNCLNPDLAVDAEGRVYVLYEGNQGGNHLGLRRTSGASGRWEPARRISEADHTLRGRLAVTADGKLHIAYVDADQRDVFYARYTSYDSLNREARLQLTDNSPEIPAITADGRGHLHIAYEQADQVFYREAVDGQLSGPVALSGKLSGAQVPIIAVDGDGRVYVSWNERNFREVHQAVRGGDTWQGRQRVSEAGVVARYQTYGHSYHGRVNLMFIQNQAATFLPVSTGSAPPSQPQPAPAPAPAPPTASSPAAPRPAPDTESPFWTFFRETGHFLAGGFRAFWERSGGLSIFGFPLTEEFSEPNADTGQVHVVQYFERQRFEYHPEHQGTPYEVLLGRLGVADAARRGLLDSPAFQPIAPGDGACAFFSETGHQVCGEFSAYWLSHGLDLGDEGVSLREAVALFGFPISEEFTDPATGLTVQYFERARFEFHPDNPEPHRVLLTRLGADLAAQLG